MAGEMLLSVAGRIDMRLCCTALLALASLTPAAFADTTYYSRHRPRHHTVYQGRHHIRKTVKRVGIGAGGGAAAGALIGGGPGAAVGAVAGGTAGAVYDHHEKRKGR
jgi:outer membrane lipoprotein SlyB